MTTELSHTQSAQSYWLFGDYRIITHLYGDQWEVAISGFGIFSKWLSAFCFEQGKSEGFDNCDQPSNLTEIGFKSSIFQPCGLEIWLMTSKNYRAPLLHYIKLCASSETPRWIRTAVAVQKCSVLVKISDFFAPCDLEIQWMTLKNNRDLLLCYIKLCASFQSHQWIQAKVTVRKRSIRAKMGDFLPCVT